jgi:hypothetical protein
MALFRMQTASDETQQPVRRSLQVVRTRSGDDALELVLGLRKQNKIVFFA